MKKVWLLKATNIAGEFIGETELCDRTGLVNERRAFTKESVYPTHRSAACAAAYYTRQAAIARAEWAKNDQKMADIICGVKYEPYEVEVDWDD